MNDIPSVTAVSIMSVLMFLFLFPIIIFIDIAYNVVSNFELYEKSNVLIVGILFVFFNSFYFLYKKRYQEIYKYFELSRFNKKVYAIMVWIGLFFAFLFFVFTAIVLRSGRFGFL